MIWLVGGIAFGTLIVYGDVKHEAGYFDPQLFIFWETILLAIILVLFYLYSRRKN